MREFSSQVVVHGQAWARERNRGITARECIIEVCFPEVARLNGNESGGMDEVLVMEQMKLYVFSSLLSSRC